MTKLAIADLHATIASLPCGPVAARHAALCQRLPGVTFVHLLGVPIKEVGTSRLEWCGAPATQEAIRVGILEALGHSAVLTYMNPRGRSMAELGSMCAERHHAWAYRWLTAGILMCGHGLDVELAFARDSRFMLSWSEVDPHAEPRAFVATATLKDWMAFTAHANDPSFGDHVRIAMGECADQLALIVPGATSAS